MYRVSGGWAVTRKVLRSKVLQGWNNELTQQARDRRGIIQATMCPSLHSTLGFDLQHSSDGLKDDCVCVNVTIGSAGIPCFFIDAGGEAIGGLGFVSH